jgi:hypothetical protein
MHSDTALQSWLSAPCLWKACKYGLPTTRDGEYGLLAAFNPPAQYQIPVAERKSGTQVFVDFFSFSPHQSLFPGVDGATFYSMIRNGLLHYIKHKQRVAGKLGFASPKCGTRPTKSWIGTSSRVP